MTKDWQPYALFILDAIAKIGRIEVRGDIRSDEVLYDAVLRNLLTLSEATQHLPDGLKASHAEVPWQQISGFRNILVHSYLGEIDPEAVLRVVKEYLPTLKATIELILAGSADENAPESMT